MAIINSIEKLRHGKVRVVFNSENNLKTFDSLNAIAVAARDPPNTIKIDVVSHNEVMGTPTFAAPINDASPINAKPNINPTTVPKFIIFL